MAEKILIERRLMIEKFLIERRVTTESFLWRGEYQQNRFLSTEKFFSRLV